MQMRTYENQKENSESMSRLESSLSFYNESLYFQVLNNQLNIIIIDLMSTSNNITPYSKS